MAQQQAITSALAQDDTVLNQDPGETAELESELDELLRADVTSTTDVPAKSGVGAVADCKPTGSSLESPASLVSTPVAPAEVAPDRGKIAIAT